MNNQCLSLVPNMGVVAYTCLPVSVMAIYIIVGNLIHQRIVNLRIVFLQSRFKKSELHICYISQLNLDYKNSLVKCHDVTVSIELFDVGEKKSKSILKLYLWFGYLLGNIQIFESNTQRLLKCVQIMGTSSNNFSS